MSSRPGVWMWKPVAMLMLLPVAYAQDTRASISGVVTDSEEEKLQGVKVTMVDLATKVEVTGTTTALGYYAIPSLAPGKYEMRVEAEDYRKYVRQDLVLGAQEKVRVDVTLEKGEAKDSVVVKEALTVLPTESATRSGTLSGDLLANVPTSNRNPFEMAWAMNEVVKSGAWGYARPLDTDTASKLSIGGGKTKENEVLVDGMSMVSGGREVMNPPAMDSIQELNVQAGPYDAQYGRTGGGVVSINTKSGGNQLHGVLFEYLQNDKLDANSSQANRFGMGRLPAHINQFGGQVQGPVTRPKDADKSHSLFFSLDWEQLRQHTAEPDVTTVPTAAIRGGDFSSLYNRLGQQVVIYDPATTKTSGARTPFAGNVIPSARLDAVAKKVMALYPAAKTAGVGPAHLYNYPYAPDWTATATQMLGRLDYVIGPRSRVFFRYGQDPWEERRGALFSTSNAAEPSSEAPMQTKGSSYLVDWTSTHSGLTTFDVRLGANIWKASSGSSLGAGYAPSQLGFTSALTSQFSQNQFPNFNLQGYPSLGGEAYGSNSRDVYSLLPSLSHVAGRHILKFGLEARKYNQNEGARGYPSGQYNYSQGWTQGNSSLADGVSGNSLASFLIGAPSSAKVVNEIAPAYSHFYYAGYLQDDVRVSSRLTVNLGLRWDVETGNIERYNRMLRGINFDAASPIQGSVANLSLIGEVRFAGTNGQPRSAFDTDGNNVAPRLGVAYRVNDKWVARFGYGLFYLGQDETGSPEGFSRTTNALVTSDGLTPYANLSNANAFVAYTNSKLLSAVGSSLGTSSFLGENVAANMVTRGLPYSHQYSLDVQRELPGHAMFQMAYAVNHTRGLPVSVDLNYIPSDSLGKVVAATGVLDTSYYVAKVTNPMRTLIPNNPTLNGSTLMRQFLLVNYPQFSQVTLNNVPIGKQNYNGFSMNFTKRFSQGLTFLAAFTASKNLEQTRLQNPQGFSLTDYQKTSLLNEPVQESDIPQRLVMAGVYEMPFGKGRRYATDANALLNGIVGGWQLGWNVTYQRGFVISYPNAPQAKGGSAILANGSQSSSQWFDTSLWLSPTTGNIVTVPNLNYQTRTFPFLFSDVRGPGYQNCDVSISKSFPIRERFKLLFRSEVINVMNHAWFAGVASTDVTSAAFGQLQATQSNLPRSIKLALRLSW